MHVINKNQISSFYTFFKYASMKESMHGTRQKGGP